MIRKFYLPVSLLFCLNATAQLPEDAIRMSWNVPSGTARHQAIGGAMGSLGGEITSLFVNPAGLGFYKTGEFVLTPGIALPKGKSEYFGNKASTERTAGFHYGTSGVVWGYAERYSRWTSKAFSIGINRTANFNSNMVYEGQNDYSSFSEPLANEFFNYYIQRKENNPSLSNQRIIDDALSSEAVSVPTKMALYTYLVDIDSANGSSTVFSRAERVGIVNQRQTINTKGGITEVAFGFAGNMDDKIYIGGSIGVPIVNYERTSILKESDASTASNEFGFSSFQENYTSSGLGINLKLGAIFKPAEYVRIGLGLHTPTIYGLKDQSTTKMVTDVEQLFAPASGLDSVTSPVFGADPEIRYDLVSPWKFMLSGSYVFREAQEVERQKGFLTADIEYVTYGSSRFSSADDIVENEHDAVNEAVKTIYKGAFNFRVGGELKFKTIMTRLGFAHYGKPYDDKNLKGRKMNISGGLGYRNKGMFVDLTYVHSLNRDVHFPYRVEAPRANTFAEVGESNGSVLLTVGLKF